MKIRNAAAITLSLLLALPCASRDTPIYNGKLTSDLDANGFYIRNLPPDFIPAYPDFIPAYLALANVTNAQGGAVSAADVGALPVNNTDGELNFGILYGKGISLGGAFYGDDFPGMTKLRSGIESSYFGGGLEVQGTISITDSEFYGKSAKLLVNGTNVMDAIAAVDSKVENAVLPTNPAFSNAVLAVGLNIDTNSVAVLNEIASTFGGFQIEGTATTVGGLLAALAAAIAWLKKNKVQTLKLEDGSIVKTAENGVAKVDDFFKESNSLLNGRLTYSRNATGLKDRAFNTLSFDGTEFNLSTALEAVTPTASGQPRDLLIVATATAATTIGYTAGTIKGDKPTIDGSGTWLITLTEYASGVWYCRQIKMEDAA